MIQCKQDGDSLLVPVRVQPGASRERIAGEHAGALKIAVTCPPERGRANAAAADILAQALGLRPSAVRLVSGQTSRNKIFRVTGITPEAVNRLLPR